MRQFQTIGRSFRLVMPGEPMREFYGPIVASPDAFYLVPARTAGEMVMIGLGASFLGQLGAILAVGGFVDRDRHILETDLASLPINIREHPDWPFKRYRKSVIVVPRNAIQRINNSFWGTFDLIAEGVKFRIVLS